MLKIENIPIGEIKPFKNNAKLHPREQIEQIKRSIQEFGFNDPIALSEENEVIEGHGRLLALKELGYTEVPCIRLIHLSEEQRRAYILAHNKLTMNTGFDMELLFGELDFLKGMDFNTELTGFTMDEIEKMYEESNPGEVKDDEFDMSAALEKAAFVLPGDVWHLGRHRLMCGDSTKSDDVARLMEGKKANMCLTDAPYNVNYSGKAGKILNDNMPKEQFYDFLLASFRNIYDNLADGGAFYCFHADSEKVNFYNACVDAEFHYSTTCIWVKDSLVLGRLDYQQRHEPVLYAFKNTKKHSWYADRKQTSVWEFPRPKKSEYHSTQKPVPLMAYPIGNSTQANGIVLEPFSGSFSTGIACEQLSRICYAMEYDPKYASASIRRYHGSYPEAEIVCEREGARLLYADLVKEIEGKK